MRRHVRILAILHIVLGGLGVMTAVAVVGLSTGLMDFFLRSDQGGTGVAGFAVTPWVGIVEVVAIAVLLLVSLPGLIAGIGLLGFAPWARILTLVLSVVELPGVPVHTALGIYGLWAPLSNDGAALFSHAIPRTT